MRLMVLLSFCLCIPIYADDKIDELVRRLGDDEYKERNEAFDALHKMGHRILSELKNYKEKTEDVQIRHLLERLILLLTEEKREAELLEEVERVGFTKEEAVKVVDFLLSDRPQFRLRGLQKLSQRNGAEATDIFLKYLDDRDRSVSLYAATALAEHSRKRSGEILLRFISIMRGLRAGTDIAQAYLNSFIALYDTADIAVTEQLLKLSLCWREVILSELVLKPDETSIVAYACFLRDSDALIRRLAKGGIQLFLKNHKGYYLEIPKESVEPLLDILKGVIQEGGDEEVASAVSILARIKAEAVPRLLSEICKKMSGAVVEFAIEGLGRRRVKEAVGVIIDAMNRDATLIPSGCKALVEIGDTSVVDTLKTMLLKPDAVFYKDLLEAIGTLAPALLVDCAVHILAKGEPTSKRDAQLALTRFLWSSSSTTKAFKKLLDVVRDGEILARLMVADVLAQVGGEAVAESLRRLFDEGDVYTKAAVVKAIALIMDAPSFAKEHLKSPSSLVRWRAAEAIALLGDIRPLLQLKRLPFTLDLKGLTGESKEVEPLYVHAKALFRLFGVNIYIDPEVKGTKRTILREGRTLLESVEHLASENGLLLDYSFGVVLFVGAGRRSLYRNWRLESDNSAPLRRALVSVVIRRDPIVEVIKRIGEYVGIQVRVSKDASELCGESSKIEAELVGIRASEALRLLLAPYSLKAELKNGVLYISK